MAKLSKLKSTLLKLGRVIIAFSGGVDSSFLVRVARDTLPREDVLAVTSVAETYTSSELTKAKRFAKLLGVRHRIIITKELNHKNFTQNPINRCYYCKRELFTELTNLAKRYKFNYVLDASNLDDKKDYRPGTKAKKEFGVRSPLQEAGFSKDNIRRHSRKLGLPTWNLPQMACLASRIPYGQKITPKLLKKIEKAEEFIRSLGVRQVRVRCNEDTVRIEVEKKDITLLVRFGNKIVDRLKKIGFLYITLDLEGYRTGSLNKAI